MTSAASKITPPQRRDDVRWPHLCAYSTHTMRHNFRSTSGNGSIVRYNRKTTISRSCLSLSLSVSTHRFTNANMHLCIYTWYRATSVHAYIYTETYHTNIMCSFYVDQNPKWRMLFKIGKSFRNKEIIYLIIWLYLYTLFRNLQISLVSFFLCFLSFMFLIFIKNISSV